MHWIGLSLAQHVDGESAFTKETAQIERYGNGFILIPTNTGRHVWVPDTRVLEATWEARAPSTHPGLRE
jgi:hypothetical protein